MPKTPQVKPDWATGIYIGNGVVATPTTAPTDTNELRMEIVDKAHAIKFGGSETGMIYAVEWNGKSYSAACTRELADKVIADMEGK